MTTGGDSARDWACGFCGKSLEGRHFNARYCGRSCKDRALWRKKNPPIAGRVCSQCGADISHKKAGAVYCSRTCKTRASDQRRIEDGRAHARDRARYQRERKHRQEYARAYYHANRDAVLAYKAGYRANNREKRAAWNANRRARKYGNPGYIPVTDAEWNRIKNRFGRRCAYCGAADRPLAMDHVVPLSRGGRHAPSNIVPACSLCNARKRDSFLVEWRYREGVMPK